MSKDLYNHALSRSGFTNTFGIAFSQQMIFKIQDKVRVEEEILHGLIQRKVRL